LLVELQVFDVLHRILVHAVEVGRSFSHSQGIGPLPQLSRIDQSLNLLAPCNLLSLGRDLLRNWLRLLYLLFLLIQHFYRFHYSFN